VLGWALGEGQYMGQESIFSYVIIVYRSSFIGKFILKIPASQIDFKYIEKKTSKNFSKKKKLIRSGPRRVVSVPSIY